MGKASKTLRQSIFLFLQNYHCFTSTPTFLAFPFAVSALLSRCFVSSSYIFPLVHARLRSLLFASGSSLVIVKLSQTILTCLFVSPFAFSFLLLAKSSVIVEVFNRNQVISSKSSLVSIFKPLVVTQLCNTLVIISSNAALFIFFRFLGNIGLSSSGTVAIFSSITYSFVAAYAYIICNLALVVSGLEKRGGFVSILKACDLIHGRSSSTAVSLAVLMNIALSGVEALFRYRILRAASMVAIDFAMVMEGLFIAYLYALLLVLDTIITCVFWRRCGEDYQVDQEDYCVYFLDRERLLP